MSVFDYLGCRYQCDVGTSVCGWLLSCWKSKIFHVVCILAFDTRNNRIIRISDIDFAVTHDKTLKTIVNWKQQLS